MDYKAYALMAILLASVASVAFVGTAHAQTSSVTVDTDKDSYTTGDEITISGKVTNVQTGNKVLVRVFDPKGTLARTDPVDVAADGSWSYKYPSGGPYMRESGDYKVIANYRGISQETTFAFVATDSWRPWTVSIGGNSYVIRYQISGGSLQTVAADVPTSTMTFGISSTGAGILKLQLPRSVMQALSEPNVPTGGTDVEYVVFADGIEAVFDEAENPTTGTRELTIDFEAGTEEFEVVGTWIVPEFGAIAAIVLAVAIVGIIVATARYGKLNSFLPRL